MVLLPHIPSQPRSSSRRVQQRRPFPSQQTVTLADSCIDALNLLDYSLNSSDILDPMKNVSARQHHRQSSSPSAKYSFPPSSHSAVLSSSSSESSSSDPQGACARHSLQSDTIFRCHKRIYDACHRFRRSSPRDGSGDCDLSVIDDSSIFNDLSLPHLGISSTTTPIRTINASKVSLPAIAGTANLLDILPPHLANLYSQPSKMISPPAVKLHPKSAFICSQSQYVKLIKRMFKKGMISFTRTPMAVNGVFGVDKDSGAAIRLIIDARPVNSMFPPSPHINLPTPDIIAQFSLPPGSTLFAAKADLDNFYHRIRLPPQWWPYFALPAINSSLLKLNDYPRNTIVYPCCTTLPMGFSHSVFIAQAAHEHIINTRVPLLPQCDRLIRLTTPTDHCVAAAIPAPPVTDYSINRIRHSVYIDDLNIYGAASDVEVMNAALDQYLDAMDAANLPAKPSKVVRPSCDGVECLGIMVNGSSCEVGMSVPKLQILRSSTLALLDRGYCTGRELASIVGRWNWAMLIRRPAMAVFSAVYRYIECAQLSVYTLWPSVRRELWCAAHLAPLLFARINADFAPVVIATDASEVGCGVVYANTTSSLVPRTLAVHHVTPGASSPPVIQSFITSSDWKCPISHRWDREEHINGLEVRSVLAAVRWAVKCPHVLSPSSINHSRIVMLCDSAVTVGAITKGRSSSHTLLRPIRSISSLLLAAGLYISLKWISTHINPADAASRRC